MSISVHFQKVQKMKFRFLFLVVAEFSVVILNEAGFQIDVFSLAFDWLISNEHRFDNPF